MIRYCSKMADCHSVTDTCSAHTEFTLTKGIMLVWTAVLGALVILLMWRYITRRRLNLPPGPTGLPILGNLLQLDANAPHVTITNWSQQFGNVLKFQVLGRTTVVLNDYDTIYNALVTNSNTFAGRPPIFRLKLLLDHCGDISFSTYSPGFVSRKKAAMQALKMYGDNLENLELITLELIDDMHKELAEAAEQGPFDVYPIICRCTTGIMTSILYGHKIDENKARSIIDSFEEGGVLTQPTGPGVLLDMFPWLQYFPNQTYKTLVKVAAKTRSWVTQELEERKATHEPGNRHCVMDALFDDQQKGDERQGKMRLTDSDVYGINHNLIFAGTVTTSLTTYMLVAILVNKPELQKKLADDILSKLGDQIPRLSDRKILPYVDAVIYETLRYTSLMPLNVPHLTMEDTKINGYDVPKNTELLFNLWKLHHDPAHWDSPWEFRPERYLDEDGSVVPADHINRKRLFAFGAGRRVCVGETLAKNRLFLLVTSLVQHYQFLPAGPNEAPKHDPREYRQGFGIEPHKYRVKLVPRKRDA